jgi:hypothetical protein
VFPSGFSVLPSWAGPDEPAFGAFLEPPVRPFEFGLAPPFGFEPLFPF